MQYTVGCSGGDAPSMASFMDDPEEPSVMSSSTSEREASALSAGRSAGHIASDTASTWTRTVWLLSWHVSSLELETLSLSRPAVSYNASITKEKRFTLALAIILYNYSAVLLKHGQLSLKSLQWAPYSSTMRARSGMFFVSLTQWSLVTPFGDIDLGQHWLR